MFALNLKFIQQVADYLAEAGQEVAHTDWSSARSPVVLVLHIRMSKLCLMIQLVPECDALKKIANKNIILIGMFCSAEEKVLVVIS